MKFETTCTQKIISLVVVVSLVVPFAVSAGTSTRNLVGVLKGKKKKIAFTVDSDTYNTIYNVPRLTCNQIPGCTGITDRDRTIINNETQKTALAPLVAAIRAAAKKTDDQVRVAVSLVQHISYDTAKADAIDRGESTHLRFPYEVLYDNSQICSENSYLTALLLTELGYGAAVFIFPNANHDVAGVKCPTQYSYQNTGYCFIETTYRNVITYDTMANRDSSGMLLEELTPTGLTFNPKTDYKDVQSLKKIYAKWSHLSKKNRKKYKEIKKKYGL
jgi:hypothetical protein